MTRSPRPAALTPVTSARHSSASAGPRLGRTRGSTELAEGRCPLKRSVVVGLDSGSTSVNAAVVDAAAGEIVEVLPYERHHNRYEAAARAILTDLITRYDVQAVNVTGSTGKALHRTWPSTSRAAEVEAQAAGILALEPRVEAVIDGGGSEIKFFKIDRDGNTYDFAMNPECAAGAGSFLDVQAKRLLLAIDDDSDPARHFPTLGLEALCEGRTVPISGRCSVFAKSDMVHQQQKAAPVAAIVGGLHEAMVENMLATVIRHGLRDVAGTVSFQGGLSRNAALRYCLARRLGSGPYRSRLRSETLRRAKARRNVRGADLSPERLVYHELGYATGAIGAALAGERKPFDPGDIDRAASGRDEHHVWARLTDDYAAEKRSAPSVLREVGPTGPRLRAYLGVDVGSVSTNVALVEEASEQILAKCYRPTAGRPIEAVKRGLADVVNRLAEKVGASGPLEDRVAAVERRIEIAGVATTGSGRFMTGRFLNADCIRNEITAQATGATRLTRPLGIGVDTIFEIGGQDSKYIRLDRDGGVCDFTMNKVCAAGCGSFLEEQADRLAINIEDEFASLALSAARPADLGDRCTVFIESVMDNLAGRGVAREDLVAGLAYSVAMNYLNRVVEGRDTGGNVFLQGGTALNEAVVRAFQKILRKPVRVTPHCDVTGAVGAACLARDFLRERLEAKSGYGTRFLGLLDAVTKPYESEERVCRRCPNRCELQVVKVKERALRHGGGTEPDGKARPETRLIFYGDRCDEMNVSQGRGRTKEQDTYVDRRNGLLFGRPSGPAGPTGSATRAGVRIGIPRALSTWGEHLPLWRALFAELGCEVVLSGPTTRSTVLRGAALSPGEYCAPVRTGHGAVEELLLLEPRVEFVFVPHLISYEKRNEKTNSYACLWTQCLPVTLAAAFDFDSRGVKLLAPVCEFDRPEGRQFELIEGLAEGLGIPTRRVRAALSAGLRAMHQTRTGTRELGRSVLRTLGGTSPAFLLIGRPYNTCDPGLSLDLSSKLARLGHPAIPMDFLPLEEVPLADGQPNMYWKNGERILSAFRYAAEREWLMPVWVTNFGCGPDSFIRKQVPRVMGGRPYLELELDDHTADAGVVTRIEAFHETCRNAAAAAARRRGARRDTHRAAEAPAHRFEVTVKEARDGRVVAFCRMDDAAFALAAVLRSRGIEAVVLPRTTSESLALGKSLSSGKECVPYQATLGDKLFFLTSDEKRYQVVPGRSRTFPRSRRVTPRDVIFYDPAAQGPCRMGQYNEGYKRVYEELGFDVGMLYTSLDRNSADVFGGRWAVLAWDGISATDTLRKARRTLRPVVRDPRELAAVHDAAVADVVAVLERPGGTYRAMRAKQSEIEDVLRRYARAFAAVERDPAKEADVANVGMFGEIYVRSEPFINEFLVEKLAELGIRTFLAPLGEWLEYANSDLIRELATEARWMHGSSVCKPWELVRRAFDRRREILPRLKRRYTRRRLERLERPFAELPGWSAHRRIEETIAASRDRLPPNVKGEMVLGWGLARELQKDADIHGIVNIGPFNCMPSKVVSTLLGTSEITKPVYDANYDGSIANSRSLRVETFASQVKAFARDARRPERPRRAALLEEPGAARPRSPGACAPRRAQ